MIHFNFSNSKHHAEAPERAFGRLKQVLLQKDAVVVGAGAGLSSAAGFTYSGERFHKYFSDFAEIYRFQDMYAGGFYPYRSLEEKWAYWSRYVYINRYASAPKPIYANLLQILKKKEYFVLTTNVDHQFQRAGFAKQRIFYTQGDYGLFQCSRPCHAQTYDNEEIIRQMIEAQGFVIAENGSLILPEGVIPEMKVPSALVPRCPRCGSPMSMNLRADDTFVEDQGWHKAAQRYQAFIGKHKNAEILFWEIGVGWNTPGIIKYPFWEMTQHNTRAFYACVNLHDAQAPEDIGGRSLCLKGDIAEVLRYLAE